MIHIYTYIYVYIYICIYIPLKSMLIVFEHISTLPTPRLCSPYCRPAPPLKIEPGKDNGGGVTIKGDDVPRNNGVIIP